MVIHDLKHPTESLIDSIRLLHTNLKSSFRLLDSELQKENQGNETNFTVDEIQKAT